MAASSIVFGKMFKNGHGVSIDQANVVPGLSALLGGIGISSW
jgi:hypothetical protein